MSARPLALAGVWVAGVALSAGALVLILESNHLEDRAATAALLLTATLSFITSGVIAIWQRPENRTGLLLAATGFAWLLGALVTADNTWIFTAGFLVSSLAWGPFAHLILAYPSGLLQTRGQRILVGATYALTFVEALALALLGGSDEVCGGECPESAITVWSNQTAVDVVVVLGTAAAVAIVVSVLVILLRRWRAATAANRRALGGVLFTAGTTLVLLLLLPLVEIVSERAARMVEFVALGAFGAVPIAFMLGLIRARLARAAAGDLLLELGSGTQLRDALARALHDPTLDIAYYLTEEERYVNAEGRTMRDGGGDRVAKYVERDGRPIAALLHDRSLLDEPELVESVAAAAALWLENERLQAELRSQYTFLLTVVHTAPSLLIVVDTLGRIQHFNRAVEIASGLDDPEQIKDRFFWEVFFDPEGREEIREQFEAAAPDFEPAEYEHSFTNARGEHLVIAWTSAPLRGEDGRVHRVIAGGVDITERKHQELELRANEERLRAAIESSPVGIIEVDLEGYVRTWNPTAEEMFGWTAEELSEGRVYLIPDEHREEFDELMARVHAGETVAGLETVRKRKDGSLVDVEVSSAPIRDSAGAVVGHMSIFVDITDRKRQELELRASEERLRAAIESSPVAIVEVGLDSGITSWNPAAEKIFGWTEEEATSGPLPMVPDDRLDEYYERVAEVRSGHSYTGHETVRRRKDGSLVDVAIASAPIQESAGAVIGHMALFVDITERKVRENALRESEERLRAAIEASPVAIVEMSLEDRVLAWNRAAERMFGWSAQEVVGETLPIVPPGDEDAARALNDRVEVGEVISGYEAKRRRRDGTDLDVEISAAPLRDSTGKVIGGMALYVDVSDRNQRESALRASEARLRASLEASPVAIVELAVDGSVLMWNPAAERMFGWTPEEVVGSPLPVVPERLRREYESLIGRLQGGEVLAGYETVRQTKSGMPIDVEISSAPIRDSDGTIVGYMSVYVDVTERKRRELEVQRERDFLDILADAVPSFLVVVDTEGRLVREGVNRAYMETFLWTAEETEGRSFFDLVAPDDGYNARMAIAAAANGVARTDLEGRWLRRDGETRTVAWTATPLLEARDIPLVLVTGADVTERVQQESEIRASRQRIVEAGDKARHRLERNLHDGAQQRLVALSITLRLAEAKLAEDAEGARQLLTASRDELSRAIDELRELARGIHPAVLTDRGLEAALEALTAKVPLPVEVTLPGERLPAPVEAAAYYLIAEALTNVTKYAAASSARVAVTRLDGTLTVEVADDGVGGADPAAGSGLRGLADRVAALDGTLVVESRPGEGTCVRAEIPVQEPALSK